VYARWEAEEYRITYNVNGGNSINPGFYTVEDLPFLLPPATRTGYVFGGWYDNSNLTGTPVTAVTTIPTGSATSRTFYAQWNNYSYTVSFKRNDGTDNTLDTKTVNTPATTIGMANFPVNPIRNGYNFTAWNTQADGLGTNFTYSTTVTANISVYARWTLTTPYNITYNLDGGTNPTSGPTSYTVESSTITLPTPTRTNYTFAGWYDNSGFTGNPVTTIPTGSTGNRTFYARWAYNFGITLDPADAGDGALAGATLDMSKNGTPNPTSQTISVNGTSYTNPRWFVDGTLVGTATSIILYAADYGLGGHKLTLIVTKSGVSWSKEISFTVTY
jgi:uncharacterized repeat protein (TIGR02543 family)